jgi:hypothetical protein
MLKIFHHLINIQLKVNLIKLKIRNKVENIKLIQGLKKIHIWMKFNWEVKKLKLALDPIIYKKIKNK